MLKKGSIEYEITIFFGWKGVIAKYEEKKWEKQQKTN